MTLMLSLPGVPFGTEPPLTDSEILISDGHVIAARLRDHLGRRYRLAQVGVLALAAAGIFHYAAPPLWGIGSGLQSTPNWPTPAQRVAVTFSANKFSAFPVVGAAAAKRLSASFGDPDLTNLPPGMNDKGVGFVVVDVANWVNQVGSNGDMSQVAGPMLPGDLRVVKDRDFTNSLSIKNLIGGAVLGVPSGPLGNTSAAANSAIPGASEGPFYLSMVVDKQVGLYVLASNGSSLLCTTISGPAIFAPVGQAAVAPYSPGSALRPIVPYNGPGAAVQPVAPPSGPLICPAADQNYVDAEFAGQSANDASPPGLGALLSVANSDKQ